MGKMGFDLESEDELPVRDGVAEDKPKELTDAEHVALFVSLCETLRSMGCVEVRANGFVAKFGAPPAPMKRAAKRKQRA